MMEELFTHTLSLTGNETSKNITLTYNFPYDMVVSIYFKMFKTSPLNYIEQDKIFLNIGDNSPLILDPLLNFKCIGPISVSTSDNIMLSSITGVRLYAFIVGIII